MSVVKHIVGALQGKHPLTARRSGKWPAVRARHLAANPCCAVCGGAEKLEVHHKQPFHLNPALELDPTNLITLCEASRGHLNCHLTFGHLLNYRAFNPTVADDAAAWRQKILARPLALPKPEGVTP